MVGCVSCSSPKESLCWRRSRGPDALPARVLRRDARRPARSRPPPTPSAYPSQPSPSRSSAWSRPSGSRSSPARRAACGRPGPATDLEPHARRVLDAVGAAAAVGIEGEHRRRRRGRVRDVRLAASLRAGRPDPGVPRGAPQVAPPDRRAATPRPRPMPSARVRWTRPSSRCRSTIAGLDVRPLFAGEVFYVSANPRHTRRPVVDRGPRGARPSSCTSPRRGSTTRPGCSSRRAPRRPASRCARGSRWSRRTPPSSWRPSGLGDTYAPQILRRSIDPRLTTVGFDPPLVDTFALITRTGARVSRPVGDFVDRVRSHLMARIGARSRSD